MDNMALPVGSEKCVNLLYNDYSSRYVDVNTEAITNILNRVEKEKPDVTIVLLHWGSEFNDTRSTSQNKIRDLLQELGADVIIGTHPHYVQPIEYSESAGTLVAYSLGDFVSDADRMGTEYGIILNVEITKDNATGETKVTGYEYIPTYSYEDEDGMMRVLRIDPAIFAYEFNYLDKVTKEVYEDLKNAKSRIEARVKP
jgi:poly-gamma-glutamate synthesis protein (capsule biosynthesis protein)